MQCYNERTKDFVKRITAMSGLGDQTFLPEGTMRNITSIISFELQASLMHNVLFSTHSMAGGHAQTWSISALEKRHAAADATALRIQQWSQIHPKNSYSDAHLAGQSMLAVLQQCCK